MAFTSANYINLAFLALILSLKQLVHVESKPIVLPPLTNVSSTSTLKYMGLEEKLRVAVPALYVFGDSSIDAGNNNYLNTRAKLNFPPYGVDFEGGVATGRATNGRTVVDFIAQFARLPFPPPHLGLIKAHKKIPRTGANYGSGSSGILPMPPAVKSIFLDVLSLDEQIEYFKNTTKSLKGQFDSPKSFASHMSKSLLFINIGTNDLGNYWELGNLYEKFHNVEKYALFLSKELKRRLKALYKLGGRKFQVNNVSPLGCRPAYLHSHTVRNNSSCVEEVNQRVAHFNGLLPNILTELGTSLKGSTFVKLGSRLSRTNDELVVNSLND